MKDRKIVVNSETSLAHLIHIAKTKFEEEKYIVWEWKKPATRSLSANALLHVWLSEYCAFLLNISKSDVNEEMLVMLKKQSKAKCYAETGQPWLITKVVNPFKPDKVETVLTSSSKWSPSQCFYFMEWLQSTAAEDGLILESKGEYLANKKQGQV